MKRYAIVFEETAKAEVHQAGVSGDDLLPAGAYKDRRKVKRGSIAFCEASPTEYPNATAA